MNCLFKNSGTTQGIATIEYIFEHLAHYLKKDPLEVRLNNLIKDGGTTLGIPGMAPNGVFNGVNLIPYLVDEMKKNADYEKRKKSVEEFNKVILQNLLFNNIYINLKLLKLMIPVVGI